MPRIDGRAPDQLRPVKITPNYLRYAEGSALIEMGDTHVLCAASVEESLPPWMRSNGTPGRGWVTAEYAMLPRSGKTRSQREGLSGRVGGRTQEIQRLIGRAMRGVIDLNALGERTIIIDCDVIEADGGTRTAAITGAYVALVLAIRELIRRGNLKREPLTGSIAAVSVGIVGGELLLDLNYAEDSRAEVDCNIVMTGSGAFVEVQGTAEGKPFSRAQLGQMLDLAESGIRQLTAIQEEVLRSTKVLRK